MNTRKTLLILLSLLLALTAFTSSAAAQEEEPPVQNPVMAYLAGLTGMTYDEIVALEADGNGLGDIARAYLFSQATGTDLIDALAQAAQGDWGQMFLEAGLHPSNAGLGSLFAFGEDGDPGPPEWAGPPEGVGGPPEGVGGPPEGVGGPPEWAGGPPPWAGGGDDGEEEDDD